MNDNICFQGAKLQFFFNICKFFAIFLTQNVKITKKYYKKCIFSKKNLAFSKKIRIFAHEKS